MNETQKSFEDRHMPEPNSGCWLWDGPTDRCGYGQLSDPATGKTALAHRVAYRRVHGSIPPGLNVLHRCDVRCCVNPDHLYAGTPADNVRDMMRRGRHRTRSPRGEANGNAKLTTYGVLAIRASSEPIGALVACYGVAYRSVKDVRTRRTWRHIP